MTTVGGSRHGLRLLGPGQPGVGDALRGGLNVASHRSFGRAPVARRDEIEQFLVGSAWRRTSSGSSEAAAAEEVAEAAAQLRRDLQQQRVIR